MLYKYFPFAGILIILLNSCAAKTDNNKAAKSNAVDYIEGVIARPALLEQNITVSGTLKPFEETVLVPDIGGTGCFHQLPGRNACKQGYPACAAFQR